MLRWTQREVRADSRNRADADARPRSRSMGKRRPIEANHGAGFAESSLRSLQVLIVSGSFLFQPSKFGVAENLPPFRRQRRWTGMRDLPVLGLLECFRQGLLKRGGTGNIGFAYLAPPCNPRAALPIRLRQLRVSFAGTSSRQRIALLRQMDRRAAQKRIGGIENESSST